MTWTEMFWLTSLWTIAATIWMIFILPAIVHILVKYGTFGFYAGRELFHSQQRNKEYRHNGH